MDSSDLPTVVTLFVIALGMIWQLNHRMSKLFADHRTKLKAIIVDMEGRLRDEIRASEDRLRNAILGIERPVSQQDQNHPRPNPNHRGPTPQQDRNCPR